MTREQFMMRWNAIPTDRQLGERCARNYIAGKFGPEEQWYPMIFRIDWGRVLGKEWEDAFWEVINAWRKLTGKALPCGSDE